MHRIQNPPKNAPANNCHFKGIQYCVTVSISELSVWKSCHIGIVGSLTLCAMARHLLDSDGSWDSWVSHFEYVAVNVLKDKQKLLWLQVQLSGQAYAHCISVTFCYSHAERATRNPTKHSQSSSNPPASARNISWWMANTAWGRARQKDGLNSEYLMNKTYRMQQDSLVPAPSNWRKGCGLMGRSWDQTSIRTDGTGAVSVRRTTHRNPLLLLFSLAVPSSTTKVNGNNKHLSLMTW